MKKVLLSALVLAACAASAQAQIVLANRADNTLTLLGGWDFNAAGTSTTVGSLVARYNQQYTPYFASTTGPNGNAALQAKLYLTAAAGAGATFSSNRTLSIVNAPVYDLLSTEGLQVSNNSLGDQGTSSARSLLLSTINVLDNARAVFEISTLNTFNTYSGLSVAYSARNQGSADATISWSYSLDGGSSFTPIAGTMETLSNSASFSVYTADFSSVTAINGVANVLIGLEYSEAAAGASVYLDNVAIYGTAFAANVIPEPSSFAALAGLAGLGFAASRRRRS